MRHPDCAVGGQVRVYGEAVRDDILVDIVKQGLRLKDIILVEDAQAGVSDSRAAGYARRNSVRTALRGSRQRDRASVRKPSEIVEGERLEFVGLIAHFSGADHLVELLVVAHDFLGALYRVGLNGDAILRCEQNGAVGHRKFVFDARMHSRKRPSAVREKVSAGRDVEFPVPDAELRVILREYVVHIRKRRGVIIQRLLADDRLLLAGKDGERRDDRQYQDKKRDQESSRV